MAVDTLADALNAIKTNEFVGKKECVVPASKLLKSVLNVLKDSGYLKDFKHVDDKRGGLFSIQLDGKINDCKVIKPRLPVKYKDLPKLEQQFIPGVGVGMVIISTPQGIMTNTEAEKRQIGGRLIAYVY